MKQSKRKNMKRDDYYVGIIELCGEALRNQAIPRRWNWIKDSLWEKKFSSSTRSTVGTMRVSQKNQAMKTPCTPK